MNIDKSLIVLFALTPAIDAHRDYPAGTVLLETRMRYGEISYQETDVVTREDEWKPPDECEADLMARYRSSAEAKVKFLSKGNGDIHFVVNVDETPCWRKCCMFFVNCFLGFFRCTRNCFLGFIRCMRVTWAWICNHLRC